MKAFEVFQEVREHEEFVGAFGSLEAAVEFAQRMVNGEWVVKWGSLVVMDSFELETKGS